MLFSVSLILFVVVASSSSSNDGLTIFFPPSIDETVLTVDFLSFPLRAALIGKQQRSRHQSQILEVVSLCSKASSFKLFKTRDSTDLLALRVVSGIQILNKGINLV